MPEEKLNDVTKASEEQQNADRTPRREGGADSVENIRLLDSRADEKILANPHKVQKPLESDSEKIKSP
jgi:hypothetical protein